MTEENTDGFNTNQKICRKLQFENRQEIQIIEPNICFNHLVGILLLQVKDLN